MPPRVWTNPKPEPQFAKILFEMQDSLVPAGFRDQDVVDLLDPKLNAADLRLDVGDVMFRAR